MGKYIDRTYGDGKADELIQKSREIKKFTNIDLQEMIQFYSELT